MDVSNLKVGDKVRIKDMGFTKSFSIKGYNFVTEMISMQGETGVIKDIRLAGKRLSVAVGEKEWYFLAEYLEPVEQELPDKDFRVGDVVCCSIYGNGVVVAIKPKARYTHSVTFKDSTHRYTAQGCYYIASYVKPSLFHGTYEEVFGEVKDVKPKRNKTVYVNLYAVPGKCNHQTGGSPYDTPEEAKSMNMGNAVAVAVPVEVPEQGGTSYGLSNKYPYM